MMILVDFDAMIELCLKGTDAVEQDNKDEAHHALYNLYRLAWDARKEVEA